MSKRYIADIVETVELVVSGGAANTYIAISDADGKLVWTSPTAYTNVNHNLLSATHTDTLTDTVARGSLIIGNSTPKWSELAFPSTPTGKVLVANATDIVWSTNALGTMAWETATNYIPKSLGTTTGDLISFSATSTPSRITDVAVGSYLRSGGVGVLPLWSTLKLPNSGTAYKLAAYTSTNTLGELAAVGANGEYLKGNTSGLPTWVALTAGTELLPTGTEGQTLYNNGGTWTVNSGIIWDDTNGRVGIGEPSPLTTLDVVGNGRFIGSSSITLSVSNTLNTNSGGITSAILGIGLSNLQLTQSGATASGTGTISSMIYMSRSLTDTYGSSVNPMISIEQTFGATVVEGDYLLFKNKAGSHTLRIEYDGTITINGVYSLPIVTGTSGQAMIVPATGIGLEWADVGNVVGPASVSDNEIVRFNSTTGKLIQGSAITIDDTGNIVPKENNVAALGAEGKYFSDLYLGSGSVIDWNNDVTLTHSANLLTFAGGDVTVNGVITAGGSMNWKSVEITTTNTTIGNDVVVVYLSPGGVGFNTNLPALIQDRVYFIRNTSTADSVTVTPFSGDTIDGSTSAITLAAQTSLILHGAGIPSVKNWKSFINV